jgi:hypothetical protein
MRVFGGGISSQQEGSDVMPKMRKSVPILGAVGLMAAVIGPAAAGEIPASHDTAPVTQIALTDDSDAGVQLAWYGDDYYYNPAPTCGFWGKGCGSGGYSHHGGYHHHRSHRGA